MHIVSITLENRVFIYRIAGNFRKPKFLENSFQWIFWKNIFEIFSFATG